MDEARYDSLFTTIAESAQGIQPLMEAFFSFLARKTDFYYCQKMSSAQQEYPARDVTIACFEKYRRVAMERQKGEQAQRERLEAEKRRRAACVNTKPVAKPTTRTTSHPQVEDITDSFPDAAAPAEVKKSTVSESTTASGPPPVGNGGKTERYTWTQTLQALDVYIPVPKGTPARQCNVSIASDTLRVVVGGNTLVDGRLHDKIKPIDSVWTLEDQAMIHLVLDKLDAMKWWSCVIQGDAEIDTQQIVPENSKLSDLDPELRQTVEKMMFDQEQKARNLPTSDQRQQAELLEKFKRAHPEMDFSNAKISGSSFGGQGFQF